MPFPGQEIDAKLYKAAVEGRFEEFERYADSLDRLVSSKQDTILHIHLKSNGARSAEFVQKVLDRCPQLLKQANGNGDTPLHIAARMRHLAMVKMLIQSARTRDLESGLDEAREWIRMANKDKDTALHVAIWWDYGDVVEEILRAEDLDYKYGINSSGETPLYLAAHPRSVFSWSPMLNAYKHKPVAYQGPHGKTVLHAAIQFCYQSEWYRASEIIENMGSLVNEADENGWTPLHYAVCKPNHSSTVSRILEKDTRSAYMKDNDKNMTPMHLAACLGNLDAMKVFMSMCPDCAELTDYRGWNACHFAAISKSTQAYDLISQDAHLVKCKDINGYYPRDYCRALKLYESWTYLLDPDLPDEICQKKKKIEELTKDLGNGPFEKIVAGALAPKQETPEDKKINLEDKIIPELEKAKDFHLVAAALIATVTFAAAFTLPGGYVSDSNDMKLGSPILSRNAAFQAFVITDGIALVLSTSSVFIHFIMVILGYKQKYYWLMRSAFWFIIFAMGAMVVAFVTGTYAVLAPDSLWLALLTCLIGLAFFLYVLYTVIRLITKDLEDLNVDIVDTAPRYLCWDCCGPLCSFFFILCMWIFLPINGLLFIIHEAWKRLQERRQRDSLNLLRN